MDANKAYKIAENASNNLILDIYIIRCEDKYIVTDRPFQDKYGLYTIVARFYNGVSFRPTNPREMIGI